MSYPQRILSGLFYRREMSPPVFKANGNSRASVATTRLSGDSLAAYESLPSAIRLAIAEANVDLCPQTIRNLYLEVEYQARRLGLEDQAVELYLEQFDKAQQGEIENWSDTQLLRYGRPSAHVAAGATRLTESTRGPPRRRRRRR